VGTVLLLLLLCCFLFVDLSGFAENVVC